MPEGSSRCRRYTYLVWRRRVKGGACRKHSGLLKEFFFKGWSGVPPGCGTADVFLFRDILDLLGRTGESLLRHVFTCRSRRVRGGASPLCTHDMTSCLRAEFVVP